MRMETENRETDEMKKLLLTAAVLALGPGMAPAEVKVGMITTLSGGGAGLGIDVRDGFMLAIEQSGRDDIEVVIEDDQRKPDVAVQLSDKMIQSEKVDVLTGIIWSNLAMAVIPGAVAQGKIYLSPNAGPSALAGRGATRTISTSRGRTTTCTRRRAPMPTGRATTTASSSRPTTRRGRMRSPATSGSTRARSRARSIPASARPITPPRSRRSAPAGRIPCSSSCPAAWGSRFSSNMPTAAWTCPWSGRPSAFDQGILQAVGPAALGVVNTSQWSKDLDNPANAAFVESFEAEYGRLPSLYASQGFDTANLLISAVEKADVADKAAFRAALREADFDSTRGDFRFGPNQHPIQTIYAREVIREGDVFTNRVIGTALEDHADAYAAECEM